MPIHFIHVGRPAHLYIQDLQTAENMEVTAANKQRVALVRLNIKTLLQHAQGVVAQARGGACRAAATVGIGLPFYYFQSQFQVNHAEEAAVPALVPTGFLLLHVEIEPCHGNRYPGHGCKALIAQSFPGLTAVVTYMLSQAEFQSRELQRIHRMSRQDQALKHMNLVDALPDMKAVPKKQGFDAAGTAAARSAMIAAAKAKAAGRGAPLDLKLGGGAPAPAAGRGGGAVPVAPAPAAGGAVPFVPGPAGDVKRR